MRPPILLLAGVAIAAAIIIHLSYVLFFPPFAMERMMERSIVTAESGGHPALLAETNRDEVVAMCRFNLDQGDLALDAAMPDGLWSLTVYGSDGADLYAVNDRQAGTDRFRLTVKKAPSWLELLKGGGDAGAEVNDGWSVEIDTARGVAVFWAALDDRAMRDSVAQALTASTCRVEAAESG